MSTRMSKTSNISKTGFTLIELLAVILILGIIALIAIPVISKIVENSKKEVTKTSVQSLIKATEQYYNKQILSNEISSSVIFSCDGEKCKNEENTLEIRGKLPQKGNIVLNSEGKIGISLLYYGYCVTKEFYSDDIKMYDCSNSIEINTIEDLVDLAKDVDAGNNKSGSIYVLTRNLDFNDDTSYDDATSLSYGDINGDGTVNNIKTELTTSTGWNPIGYRISSTNTAIFAGTFNGMSNTISNLYINRTSENAQALFANTTGNIENININGKVTGNALLSLLIANMTSGKVNNCYAKGEVNSLAAAGGSSYISLMIGQVEHDSNNTITNNIVEGIATGQNVIGGLIGFLGRTARLENNFAKSTITGNNSLGGLVGSASTNVTINNSYANSTVTGNNYVGGLVGSVSMNATINNSYANSTVTGNNCVGGLAGIVSSNSIVSNSHANATITGVESVGGLLGQALSGSVVYNCYSKGTISSTLGGTGGLIGLAAGTVKNSYSNVDITVSATSAGNVGGLIGLIGCTDCDHSIILVQNNYATGNIINNSTAESGTLIGQNGASSENARTKYLTLRNSYAIGNMQGINKVGLIGIEVMNAENLFNGGQINGITNTGNIMGITEGIDAIVTNSYSFLQTKIMTNQTGMIVDKNTLKTTDWWINNLKTDSNWKYEDGYYPLLYKLDSNGNLTTILLDGQNKIKIE